MTTAKATSPPARRVARRSQSFGQVLRRAQHDDGDAFAELFTTIAPRVRSFASARGAADPDAIANETFLRVFQNLHTFRGPESAFVGWVFRIARNLLIDEYRARRVRPQEVEFDGRYHATGRAVVDEWLDERSEAEQMAQMLERLTPQQREVVLLRVVAGLSFKEIGAAVDQSATSVRSTYKRARTALAGLVADEDLTGY